MLVSADFRDVFDAHGVATSRQVLTAISRRELRSLVAMGKLHSVWQGVYSNRPPDLWTKLAGLDARIGDHVAVCLHTAAHMYGFDTENVSDLHVLASGQHLLRSTTGLKVHRRDGAPLCQFMGRTITAPAWTAVEVARTLRRPRALATLDLALRSRHCVRAQLMAAAEQQRGRRGITHVRELIPLANGKAESPMESEARLVMHDGGLPDPDLQHEIVDLDGISWRVDFAWPDAMLAVEYDGFEFHSNKKDLRRDRHKRAALQELTWTVISFVDHDVRVTPQRLVRRISAQLDRA